MHSATFATVSTRCCRAPCRRPRSHLRRSRRPRPRSQSQRTSTGTTLPNAPQATEPPPTLPTPDVPSSHPEIKDGDRSLGLQIPAIGLDKIVVSGVFSDDLKHGPGHYPNTPLPGEVGNAGIAGHRTTYGSPFGDLDKLQRDDQIIVTTTAGRFRFDVVGTKIVQPSDASFSHRPPMSASP